jgi:hypothetical protein
MVSVFLPGMQIMGSLNASVIMPYGVNGATGTGGVGTYSLAANQVNNNTFTIATVTGSSPTWTITTSGSPSQIPVPGAQFTQSGVTGTFTLASITGRTLSLLLQRHPRLQ